jgi:hypothetical protein
MSDEIVGVFARAAVSNKQRQLSFYFHLISAQLSLYVYVATRVHVVIQNKNIMKFGTIRLLGRFSLIFQNFNFGLM